MPQEPNRLLRILVPLAVLGVGGIGIFFAVTSNSSKTATPPANPTTTPNSAAPTSAPSPAPSAGAQPPAAAPPSTTTPPPPATPQMGAAPPPPAKPVAYTAKTYQFGAYFPLGSTTPKDKGGTFEMEVRFSGFGAGMDTLTLANYFKTIQHAEHETIQRIQAVPPVLNPDPRAGTVGFAADSIEIDGSPVSLRYPTSKSETFWNQISPGSFEAEISDPDGKAVIRITRTFKLAPGSLELTLDQKVENLTDHPIKIVWRQFGPASLPSGTIRYGGDVRRVRFGYLLPPAKDPYRFVIADDRSASLVPYHTALGKEASRSSNLPLWDPSTLWPSSDSKDLTLAWAGMSSRYFTVAMYPRTATPPQPTTPATQPAPGASGPGRGDDKAFTLVSKVERFAISTGENPDYGIGDWVMGRERKPIGEMVLRMTSPELTIQPGESTDINLGIYAGPSSKKIIESQPGALNSAIQQVVLYTFGGPCGFCTFQAVAQLLRNLLAFLHDHILFDWALSIMFLVVCVRTVLHPVTRFSQKRMLFFSKEMAKLAPAMKQIQEKYKDDPVKLRQEQSRVMQEHGTSYAGGALGCLPGFLQTPVWIGLSAMIYFNFDLRQSPAFFGIFQNLSAGRWGFLGDMSESDKLISFGTSLHVPVLSSFMGPIDGLNLLPLLLGVVFYIQQKYLTPPPTAPLTPEQEQQQKIMKVMMVVLFPLMMYNAPAGLALYFATNTTLAIIESKWIRRHAEAEYVKRQERKAQQGPRFPGGSALRSGRNSGQPEGWFARFQRIAQEAQKSRQQRGRDKRGPR